MESLTEYIKSHEEEVISEGLLSWLKSLFKKFKSLASNQVKNDTLEKVIYNKPLTDKDFESNLDHIGFISWAFDDFIKVFKSSKLKRVNLQKCFPEVTKFLSQHSWKIPNGLDKKSIFFVTPRHVLDFDKNPKMILDMVFIVIQNPGLAQLRKDQNDTKHLNEYTHILLAELNSFNKNLNIIGPIFEKMDNLTVIQENFLMSNNDNYIGTTMADQVNNTMKALIKQCNFQKYSLDNKNYYEYQFKYYIKIH